MKYHLLLFFIALVVGSCRQIFPDAEPTANPQAVFEHFWQEFDALYGPFADRQVDWDAQYAEFAPQLSGNSSEEDLYDVLSRMIFRLDDGHVTLTAPGKPLLHSNRIYREKIDYQLFNPALIREKYLGSTLEMDRDSFYFSGLLNDSIVYVHFKVVGAFWQKLADLKEKYPDAAGFIVDLRHNSGGDFTYALPVIAQFNTEERLVFRSRTKNGPETGAFTSWCEWMLPGNANGPSPRLAVLTDRYTISAAERAVLAFRTLPNATLVGDTTNGATSTMIARELPNGWYYTMATQEVRAGDGQIFEGKGIPPAIRIQNTPADLAAGRDIVLEKALTLFH